MLTRYHLSVLGLLAAAFLGITAVKYAESFTPAQRAPTDASSSDTLAQANQFWAVYRKATDARTSGRYEEAAHLYREALDRRPAHRDARFYLGEALLQSGQLEAAGEEWERLLEEAPGSARVQGQLGGLSLCSNRPTQRDLARAKKHFRAVARIHGEYDAAPRVRLAQIGAVQDSLRRIEEALDVMSGRTGVPPEVTFLRGYVAWREGRSQRATVNLARSRQALVADTAGGAVGGGFRVPPPHRNDMCRVLTDWRPDLLGRAPEQIDTDAVYSRFRRRLRKSRQAP